MHCPLAQTLLNPCPHLTTALPSSRLCNPPRLQNPPSRSFPAVFLLGHCTIHPENNPKKAARRCFHSTLSTALNLSHSSQTATHHNQTRKETEKKGTKRNRGRREKASDAGSSDGDKREKQRRSIKDKRGPNKQESGAVSPSGALPSQRHSDVPRNGRKVKGDKRGRQMRCVFCVDV
ncbi:hypothetical protein Mapa_014838 [Marchantia paleacea]|nr:hypothetical protein Mapa_014838 [Marchantia paleacea]